MAASAEVWANAFIDTSFRDAADEDYIAARLSFRSELNYAFLWSSQQAVEKYVKAILLYNRRKTADLGHDVEKAFARVAEIRDIPFAWGVDTLLFVKYINEHGPNRYRSRPAVLRDDALLGLDRTVWHLRRHCFAFGGAARDPSLLASDLAELQRDPMKERASFRIAGGRLEEILEGKSKAREALVWKNFCYGVRTKRRIANFPLRAMWSQPLIFTHPEIYPILKSLVLFERDVKAHFEP